MTVDIIIPVLNEEKFLRQCLVSVFAFEKPEGVNWTVSIVDGGSQDRTGEIAGEFASRHAGVKVLSNPKRIQSSGLNLAIKASAGDYVLRLDAHATYPKDYLRKCVETSVRTQADNVGGVFITYPGGDGYGAQLVQALTTHRFGIGNAEYRLNAPEGAADTVPYGFFKRELFNRLGFFDERLVRNQDYELNRRIRVSGGTIWLNPAIQVHYHNQPTLSAFLKKQLTKEGPYNAYLWYLAPYAVSYRHGITGAFALGVCAGALFSWLTPFIFYPFIIVLAVYGLLGGFAGIQQALRYREWRHTFAVPVGLFLFHFCHGMGVLSGVIHLLLGTASVQREKVPWPGAGRFRAWPAQT
jgi:glycosyltransferase involved in cell wall biosynthesis